MTRSTSGSIWGKGQVQFQFADGSLLSQAALLELGYRRIGTAYADTLVGGAGDDRPDGGMATTGLLGGKGDDVLTGGERL